MIPTSFDESNHVLGKPEGYTDEQCDPLSVWTGNQADGVPVVISCWKMTAEERAEFLRTGRIWLLIHGHTMPPALLMGESPFAPPSESTPA